MEGKGKGGDIVATEKRVGLSAGRAGGLRARLLALRPAIAKAAQAVVDAWEQDDDGMDDELGEGGACDRVSDAISEVVHEKIGGLEEVGGGQDGDDHAFPIFYDDREAFAVDIPPSVYETGGGYRWKKRRGARITADDVVIESVRRSDVVDSDGYARGQAGARRGGGWGKMGRMVKISARDMKALDAARKRVAKRPCKPDDVEKLAGIPSMRARTSVKVGDTVQLSLAGERMWVRVTETLPPVPTRSEVETPRRAARVLAKDCAYFRGTLANHPVDASCKFGDVISFSRRHILKIEPAKAGKRGGRAGQASGASLDGFGFFDDEGGPEPVVTPLHELSRSLGETPQTLSAERLIKPAGLAVLASPRVHHFFKNRAWAVEIATGANPERAAAKLFKELVGKRALSASDPFMHDLTLYVLHGGGGVLRVEPPAKAAAAGPNLAEIKHKIVYRAQEFFGSGAVKEVAGGAGDYRMVIKPKGRFKGKFSEANVRGADLDTVSRDLDALIEKATKLYGAD